MLQSASGRVWRRKLGRFERAAEALWLALLSEDYFSVAEERIKSIESVLTVVAGKVVYAAEPFAALGDVLEPPPLPSVSPAWSPVAHFGAR